MHAESLATSDEREFLAWLAANGASFDKILWPAATALGRGTVALQDFEPGESFVQIPARLMMSPPHAQALPDIGHVFRTEKALLRNDNGLAVFIVHQLLLGEASFYWPYLRILPKPHTVEDWSAEDVAHLQDAQLASRAQYRLRQLRNLWERTIGGLSDR
jgi:hypothetical protein